MNMGNTAGGYGSRHESKGKGEKRGDLFSGICCKKGSHRRGLPGGYPGEPGRPGHPERTEDRKGAAGYLSGIRQDLKAEYQFRYDVIAGYAPKQMSPEEVKAYIREHFAEVLATKNKGQIMKAVMGEMKGKADGKVINQTVAELCR